MISILLGGKKHKGLIALIDEEDFERVSQHKWYADFVKSDEKFRARSRLSGTVKSAVLMHRFILNAKRGELVDHINMNPLDNRKSNLRKTSKARNMQNRNKQRNNSSGHKGVSWSKSDKRWRATIQSEGRWKFLGNFSSKEKAYKAYKKASKEMHGEFARA